MRRGGWAVDNQGRPGPPPLASSWRRSSVNRAGARRLAAVVAATALAGGSVALIAPAAQAAPLVSVLSQSTFTDSVGTDNLVGEVRNYGSTNTEQVMLDVQYMSATNQVLGSDSTPVMVDRLAPGE